MNRLTTESGASVADNQNSQTAGPAGPVLLQDQHLLEKLARFNRERIPERIVHARRLGRPRLLRGHARRDGRTRARSSSPRSASGPRCSSASRPSPARRGAPDAVRDPRGFAVKFYTEDGNYDLVGNNTPIFFIRDPLKFPDFIHSPEAGSVHEPAGAGQRLGLLLALARGDPQFTWLFGDRGIPASLPAHGRLRLAHVPVGQCGRRRVLGQVPLQDRPGHRVPLERRGRERRPGAIRSATRSICVEAIEAGELPVLDAEGADHAGRRRGELPVQPVRPDEGLAARGLPADRGRQARPRPQRRTTTSPTSSRPAFDPGHFVPGIGPSPDKMLQGRLFAYGDAHRYRLGVNHTQLPVNAPHAAAGANYGRDGLMRFDGNCGRAKNYEPNSFDGPVQTGRAAVRPLAIHGAPGTYDWDQHAEDDDFVQAGRALSSDDGGRQGAARSQHRRRARRGQRSRTSSSDRSRTSGGRRRVRGAGRGIRGRAPGRRSSGEARDDQGRHLPPRVGLGAGTGGSAVAWSPRSACRDGPAGVAG